MTEQSKIDLDKIQRLAEAATPGPWRPGRPDMLTLGASGGYVKYIYADDQRGGFHHVTGDPLPLVVGMGACDGSAVGDEAGEEALANAAFIAGTDPETTLAMVEELRRLRETRNRDTEVCLDVIRERDEARAEVERLESTNGNAAMMLRKLARRPNSIPSEQIRDALKRWGMAASPLREADDV